MTGPALRTVGLTRRFRGRPALADCTLELPSGSVAALVGPNGAGKSTLLKVATGLVAPSAGTIEVLGAAPDGRAMPAGVSFVAQDKPLYRRFRVHELLRAGAALNPGPRWDAQHVRRLVEEASIPLDAVVGALSGGQRSRLALALALGRRPALLLLDEPLADVDPLARRRVVTTLLAEVAETGMTILMSTHAVADLDGACDHLMLMREGRMWLDGGIDALLAGHHRVTGPRPHNGYRFAPDRTVRMSAAGRQMTALVRGPVTARDGLQVQAPSLEELVLAYLETEVRPSAGVLT